MMMVMMLMKMMKMMVIMMVKMMMMMMKMKIAELLHNSTAVSKEGATIYQELPVQLILGRLGPGFLGPG